MLSATIFTQIAAELDSVNGVAQAAAKVNVNQKVSYPDGEAAGMAHLMYAAHRTLADSASENLVLTGGALTDANNSALTFAHVVAIYILANSANTDDVIVGGAGSDTFVGPFGSATNTMHVKPGGALLAYDPQGTGWAVTASTADHLQVADGGSAGVGYEIVILGY